MDKHDLFVLYQLHKKLDLENKLLANDVKSLNLKSNPNCFNNRITNINDYLDEFSEFLEFHKSSSSEFQAIDIQEKERQRIARDLHDITLQNLTYVINKIELGTLFMDKDVDRAKLEFATVRKDLRDIISDIRSIIFNLHPMSFDDLGLKDSLTNFITNISANSNFRIEYDIDDIKCKNNIFMINIFRLIQEASMNALYHSGGDYIFIGLKENDQFYDIIIRDNGIGFDTQHISHTNKNHFGLSVMQERVSTLHGSLDILSSENKGTEIRIKLPIIYQGDL